MSWDWVPPRPGEEQGGPSPALRRAVTVLAVLLAATLAVFYATRAVGTGADACVRERPAGVAAEEVDARWAWWPPGYECRYPAGTVERA